ncbi:MAG: microcin transport system ATP-binding protein [Candidatus Midichloriaceae bacterium]|jgi:microcin C transport system ATP-binding protein|nr:microcin transport system ATP-binding protein [Candidatus Midichloriaceae bacterium]
MVDKAIIINNLSIRLTNSKKSKCLVKSLNLEIAKGKICALVGESGSGKTITALSILQLLDKHYFAISGSIMWDDVDLLKLAPPHLRKIRGNSIGMIFQEPLSALNPLHTIGKQLTECVKIHRYQPDNQVLAEVESLLDQVEMGDFKARLDSYPHQLSGGQRQRIMIAMALANNPKFLIADEPTTALDTITADKILSLLKKIQIERNLSVLLITHDLRAVRMIADDVYVMKNGEVVEQGAVDEIFAHPKNKYTKHLLDSEPTRIVEESPPFAPILSVKSLSYSVPKEKSIFSFMAPKNNIISNINFDLSKGETIGVMGGSGSGKTTVLLAVLRLLKAKGSIIFNGVDLMNLDHAALKPYRAKIQVVFQDPFASLNPRMKVSEIISEGPLAHRFEKNKGYDLHKEVLTALQSVELSEEFADYYPSQLSGGQRQRVAIARALIMSPEVILLDEPTSALDKPIQLSILRLLKKLQDERGLSYLLVSHDVPVINAIAHKVIVIRDGKVEDVGEAKEILKKFATYPDLE